MCKMGLSGCCCNGEGFTSTLKWKGTLFSMYLCCCINAVVRLPLLDLTPYSLIKTLLFAVITPTQVPVPPDQSA